MPPVEVPPPCSTDVPSGASSLTDLGASLRHYEKFLESLTQHRQRSEVAAAESGLPVGRFADEFAGLLDLARACVEESRRKTHKIRELLALHSVAARKKRKEGRDETADDPRKATGKLQSTSEQRRQPPERDVEENGAAGKSRGENADDLREMIDMLRCELESTSERRRQLLEQVDDLKRKLEEFGAYGESADLPRGELESTSERRRLHQLLERDVGENGASGESITDLPGQSFDSLRKRCREQEKNGESTNGPCEREKNGAGHQLAQQASGSAVLRANLDGLASDLRLTRRKVGELRGLLKKESAGELRNESKPEGVRDLRRPLEITLKTYKRELDHCKKRFEEVIGQLRKAQEANRLLAKDLAARDSDVERISFRLKEEVSEKESALRKARFFEEHLAAGQLRKEQLEAEVAQLRRELEARGRETDEVAAGDPSATAETSPDKAKEDQSMESSALRNQVALRDQRLACVSRELEAAAAMLRQVRLEARASAEERDRLEAEARRLRKTARDRGCDLRELRLQLCECKRQVADLKRDLQSQVIRNYQLAERKNRVLSQLAHMRLVNAGQRDEHVVLLKRQEYMLKALDSKDKQLKRVLSVKRLDQLAPT